MLKLILRILIEQILLWFGRVMRDKKVSSDAKAARARALDELANRRKRAATQTIDEQIRERLRERGHDS